MRRGLESSDGYRADIDGLRAIAVLSVIGFHCFPRAIRGGFIGVDVFFVISGFLITGLILKALAADRFSYLDFYARRIRRIFPALIVVLAVTLMGGAVILYPAEFKELGRQAAAGAGFFANLFFWRETDYFDAATQFKPLLHLWSLGVEEQFYIVWPLLLAFTYKRTRRLSWVIGAVLLASLAWNIATVGSDPAGAFYLPQGRFWELMCGAMLAVPGALPKAAMEATSGSARIGAGAAAVGLEIASLLGLALIAGAVFLLDENHPFPGWRALLPTVGAFLIIAGAGSRINQHVLADARLVFVGKISYPLYLWHWVLLSGAEHLSSGRAPHTLRLAVVGVTFLLSWLTYTLIESPIRFRARSPLAAPALAAAAAMVAGIAVAINLSQGAAFRYPDNVRALATFHFDAHQAYREDVCQLNGERPFAELQAECIDPADKGSRLIVMWGDSHVSSLYPGMRTLQRHRGGFRLAQFTAGGCPPLLGIRIGRRRSCLEFSQDVFQRIKLLRPDTVILGASWDSYARQQHSSGDELGALRHTVEQLNELGIRRIVVFGNLPTWKIPQPYVGIHMWRHTHRLLARTYEYFDSYSADMDTKVGDVVSGTSGVFVSPVKSLCNAGGCLISADPINPVPVTWDYAHLTDAGSNLLVSLNVSSILGDEMDCRTNAQCAARR